MRHLVTCRTPPPSLSVADGPLMGPRCRCSRAAEVLVWLAMTMENSILTGLSEMARAEVLVWLAMTMENSILTGLSEMARAPAGGIG